MKFKNIVGVLGGLAMAVAVALSSMPLPVLAVESGIETEKDKIEETEDGDETEKEEDEEEEDSNTEEDDLGNPEIEDVEDTEELVVPESEADNGIDTQNDDNAIDEFEDDNDIADSSETTLGNGTQRICEIIMDKANSVKAGESSSEFVISLKDLGYDVDTMTWTSEELGFEKITEDDEMSCLYLVSEKLGIDMNDVTLILRNEPDLYWWNTKYYQALEGFNVLDGGNKISITGISIYLPVSLKYGLNGDESWVDVNCEALKVAQRAVDNAKKIVEAAKSYNDIEKLRYYSEQICNSNIYNHEYYDDLDKGGDLDTNASQYVYVFDNDDETNVVCEGYAKSLKLLCNMTDFDNKTIECYNVSGFLCDVDENGELVNPGGHMWNIVSIDGKSYIIDLTNSDKNDKNEANQFNGYFFLNAPDRGSVEEGYVYYNSVGYVYYSTMEKIYGNGILALNDSDYEMPDTDSQEPTEDSTTEDSTTEDSTTEDSTTEDSTTEDSTSEDSTSEDSSSDKETESTPASTVVSNEPIVEDSKGWDSFEDKVEKAIENAVVENSTDGTEVAQAPVVVNVDLNGTDTIPEKVISTIAEKNVTIAVKVDKNTLVTIDGSKITPAEASEVKLISSRDDDGSESVGVRSQNVDIEKSIVIYKSVGLDKVGSSTVLYFENADKSLIEFRTSPVYENGFAAFEVPFVNANYKVLV
jgi:hypothetical protein